MLSKVAFYFPCLLLLEATLVGVLRSWDRRQHFVHRDCGLKPSRVPLQNKLLHFLTKTPSRLCFLRYYQLSSLHILLTEILKGWMFFRRSEHLLPRETSVDFRAKSDRFQMFNDFLSFLLWSLQSGCDRAPENGERENSSSLKSFQMEHFVLLERGQT